MTRASCCHIKSILFVEWRDSSVVKRLQCDTGIGQNRLDTEYPPIGNLKGRVHLHHYRREVSRTYPDMSVEILLDLVTNSLRQNGSI